MTVKVTDRSAIVVWGVLIIMSGRHDTEEALLKVTKNT